MPCRIHVDLPRPQSGDSLAAGVLTAVAGGSVTVSASCGAVAASVEAKVEAPSPHERYVAVRDADCGGVVRGVTMVFLDGPRAGETVRFDIGAEVVTPVWPVKARLSANDYRPMDFVFSEATGVHHARTRKRANTNVVELR